MNVKLTDSERNVMELFWSTENDLTSSEIIKLSKDRTWKPSYIHILINSLLEKGLITHSSFKRTTKNYARTFRTTITKEEWLAISVRQNYRYNSDTLDLFRNIIQEENDLNVIDKFIEQVNDRRKELLEVK